MGRYGIRLLLLAGAVAAPALLAGPAWAETLVYRAENKWVAPADAKPLQALRKAARNGKTYFKVKLPKDNRVLSVARLEVLQDILAREAKTAVVMEEVGVARSGTLGVE